MTAAVMASWQSPSRLDPPDRAGETRPDPGTLNVLIATALEASLLREENRPLTFRLMLRSPERFRDAADSPTELHRLRFAKPRPFTAQQLRRLTPAVDFERSLVGISADDDGLKIWGIVQSGVRWLEQFHGGRGNALDLPDSLIIGVRDPGYMVVSQGSRPLCALEGGRLQTSRMNVFESEWFPDTFAVVREELRQVHAAARAESNVPWAELDPEFTRMVARQMILRLISTIQRSRHGGTLLIVPCGRAREITRENALIRLKYRFAAEEPRARVRTLIIRAMNMLAAEEPRRMGGRTVVGWDDYGRAGGREWTELDEAIFEMAHQIATLTAVDGAVVVTRSFELLGFGGEISGSLAEVPFVARALDLEGEAYALESTEEVGTRHRSVYRLCNTEQDVLGIVVSQDGGIRFVRWKDFQVMYWNHSMVTPASAR